MNRGYVGNDASLRRYRDSSRGMITCDRSVLLTSTSLEALPTGDDKEADTRATTYPVVEVIGK